MARLPGPQGGRVYDAARRWVHAALRSDDSLFTPGEPIWSLQGLDELHQRFVQQITRGQGLPFHEMLRRQLGEAPPATIQLMGEVL